MDSRKYFPIQMFNGVVKSYHARSIPDTKVSDVMNVLFEFGKAKRRYGYNSVGNNTPLDGVIMDIIYYEKLRTGDNFSVVLTTTSAYAYDTSTGLFYDITPYYSTGDASVDGTAVSGSGTDWDSSWSGNVEKIKFGTSDPSVTRIQFTGDISDGWEEGVIPAGTWLDIAYGNGVLVAVGYTGATTGQIFRSLDGGETWSDCGYSGERCICVRYSNGTWIVGAYDHESQGEIIRSTDDFATHTVIASSYGIGRVATDGLGVWLGTKFSSFLSNAYGTVGYISHDDGLTWETNTFPANSIWSAVGFHDGTWIVLADSYYSSDPAGAAIIRSTDSCVTWTIQETPLVDSGSYPHYFNVIHSGERWITVGMSMVTTSLDDGLTWTMSYIDGSNLSDNLFSFGGEIIAIGPSEAAGVSWRSYDDGVTWTSLGTNPQALWSGIVGCDKGWFYVAYSGEALLMRRSRTITSVSALTNLYVGLELTSQYLSSGCRIRSIDFTGGTSITTTGGHTGTGTGQIIYADISTWRSVSSIADGDSATITVDASSTGDTVDTSAVIENIPDTSILHVGMSISGTGIAAETSILSIDSTSRITMSNAATATGTGVALTFGVLIETGHEVDYCFKHCFNGDADDIFSYCLPYSETIDDKILVMTNGVDKIKKWDGSGAITDLTMTGITCDWAKCVGYFGSAIAEHTVIANMNDGSTNLPHQIMVSDAGNPEAYSGAYYELLTSNDPITALKALGTRLVIYKRNSISLAWATPEGGNSDPFDLDENKVTNIGCPAPRTIQDSGSYHIFLGLSGDSVNIYAFNGNTPEVIGSDIYKDIKENISLSYAYRSFAFLVQSKNIYCLFVPTGDSEFPNRVYVFNYIEKHWSIWSMHDFMTAFGFMKQEYNPTWAEIHALESIWPDMEMRWSDLKMYSQDTFPILGDSAGYVYDFRDVHGDDNGVDIDAYIETKDYPLNNVKNTFKLLEGVIGYKGQVEGNDIEIQASIDFGSTYCNPIVVPQNTSTDIADVYDHEYAETICNFYEKGRQARFYLNNVDGSDFEIEGLTIGFTDEQGITR